MLDDQPILKNYLEATDYRKIRDTIARTPGGIGIDPQGFVSKRTNNPKTPAIVSTMIAVTKGPASPEIEKLLTYMKKKR
jgi:hypothetical protein